MKVDFFYVCWKVNPRFLRGQYHFVVLFLILSPQYENQCYIYQNTVVVRGGAFGGKNKDEGTGENMKKGEGKMSLKNGVK